MRSRQPAECGPVYSVALVEAGPRDRNLWIHLPIGYGRTMWIPKVNWKFYTEPEPQMDGRRIYWPRGRGQAARARSMG